MSKINLVRACKNCGKLQKKNEKESNKNWNVYDTNVTCECGGRYGFMDGVKAEALRSMDDKNGKS